VEWAKLEFMQKSISTLEPTVDGIAVKVEAEMGHWYNTVADSLHFSNFVGTPYLLTLHETRKASNVIYAYLCKFVGTGNMKCFSKLIAYVYAAMQRPGL
jgi:hypothetical protein